MEREDRKLENLILRIMMYLKLEIQYDYLDWETFKKKKKKNQFTWISDQLRI